MAILYQVLQVVTLVWTHGRDLFMAENMTSIWGINRGDDLKKLLQLAVVFSPVNLRHARSALTWLLGERAWSWAKIKVPSLKLT